MTIEKISDTQIRCTLTKEDLDQHQINLAELAYGTDNAKKLFEEMMVQASIECGFTTDNTPLMIEAIPVSTESIVLVITKVDDPEELDTRFSKFAPLKHNETTQTKPVDGADEILDILSKVREAVNPGRRGVNDNANASKPTGNAGQDKQSAAPVNLIRRYHFDSLSKIIDAAHGLNGFYNGENSLYKGGAEGGYILLVHQSSHTPEDFNKICNILSEYGTGKNCTASAEAYLLEHGQLVTTKALQQLLSL